MARQPVFENALRNQWDRKWIVTAEHYSEFSYDPSTKVGAVFVKDDIPLVQGYNGFARGVIDSGGLIVDRKEKILRTVHAEINCICNAAANGIRIQGCKVYLYGMLMCSQCAGAVLQTKPTHITVVLPDGKRVAKWVDSFIVSCEMYQQARVEYDIYRQHWSESAGSYWYESVTNPEDLLDYEEAEYVDGEGRDRLFLIRQLLSQTRRFQKGLQGPFVSCGLPEGTF